MAGYQININRKEYNQPVDMQAIRTALADLIEGYDQTDNQYNEEGEFVVVDSLNVGEAVHRINELGYSTDEDELTEDQQAEIDQEIETEHQIAELENQIVEEEIKHGRGGARPGAGRPKLGTTYEEGYNAGYQAGKREWLAFLKAHGFNSEEEYERAADQDWLDLPPGQRMQKR